MIRPSLAVLSGLSVIRPEPRNLESLVSTLFGECIGDLARTQQTFLIPLNGTVDQKVPQACDDPKLCTHFNQPITAYSRIEVFEMVEKHSGIELAIF
jgi:hypothetical protein